MGMAARVRFSPKDIVVLGMSGWPGRAEPCKVRSPFSAISVEFRPAGPVRCHSTPGQDGREALIRKMAGQQNDLNRKCMFGGGRQSTGGDGGAAIRAEHQHHCEQDCEHRPERNLWPKRHRGRHMENSMLGHGLRGLLRAAEGRYVLSAVQRES